MNEKPLVLYVSFYQSILIVFYLLQVCADHK